MKDIFFQGRIFFHQIFPCKIFFPSKSVCRIFFFLESPLPHPPPPPPNSKVKWWSPEVKVKAHRSYEVHRAGTWLSFCSFCEMKQLGIETFRFEDENDYHYKIWLPFFRVFSKYRYPGKLHDTFDSPEKYCHLYWRRSQPPPDRKIINLLTFFSCH